MSLILNGTSGLFGNVTGGDISGNFIGLSGNGSLLTATATGSSTARSLANRFADVVNVLDFGAVGDWNSTTGTDNATAFQTAINYASTNRRGGIVYIPAGRYLFNTTLTIPANVILVGNGALDNNGSTQIVAGNIYGPAIRVKGSYSGLKNFNIGCTNARRTYNRGDGSSRILANGTITYSTLGLTRDDQNYGVWVEPDDNNTVNIEFFSIENVWIHNQPNDGLVIVTRSYIHSISQLGVNNSNGHCVVIDNGIYTGRVNKEIPVGIHFKDCILKSSQGHGIVSGNPLQTGAPPCRIIVENVDCYGCASNSGVRYADYVHWFFADQSEIKNSAIDGTDLRPAIIVGGRNIKLNNNRYVGVTRVAKVESDMGSDSRLTQGVEVWGLNVISPPAIIATAVDVDSGVENVVVKSFATGGYTNASNANAYEIATDNRIFKNSVIVGKTVDDDNTTGSRVASGIISSSRSSNVAAIFNRNTDVGDVVFFRQAGLQKGSIEVLSDKTAYYMNLTAFITSGSVAPNGNVTAPVGSLYTHTAGTAGNVLFVKETGTGNTGWVAK